MPPTFSRSVSSGDCLAAVLEPLTHGPFESGRPGGGIVPTSIRAESGQGNAKPLTSEGIKRGRGRAVHRLWAEARSLSPVRSQCNGDGGESDGGRFFFSPSPRCA